jgi:hypothetical protein
MSFQIEGPLDRGQIPMETMGPEHSCEGDFFRATKLSRLMLGENTMGPAPSVGVTND